MKSHYHNMHPVPQRGSSGFDVNIQYLTSSQQSTSRQGLFLRRNERIDWRRIAAVDVDRIAREMDVQALQDNLENIALCNIDAEVDSHTMDPNFIKLYKMAQLTIEYLLYSQEQIGTQVADYEDLKRRAIHEQEGAQREIDMLKKDLEKTKIESKKRRKMLETQQRMLVAQNSNYHPCPVCTHAFLGAEYLRKHMTRRHPDYDPVPSRERDVDNEREIQRLKEELNRKDHELQLMKCERGHMEEKIRDRDTLIQQHKNEIKSLKTELTILEEKLQMPSVIPRPRSPSSHRHDRNSPDYLKERALLEEIEALKNMIRKTENDLSTTHQLRMDCEQKNKHLQLVIRSLEDQIEVLKKTSASPSNLTNEFMALRKQYNDARIVNQELIEELQKVRGELEKYQRHPPHPVDPKVDDVPPFHEIPGPKPVVPQPIPPAQSSAIILSYYCPEVVKRLKDNPKLLTKYREEAKRLFISDLEDAGCLGIAEHETRLTDLDCRMKMESIEQTKRNIQQDLPAFDSIRANISRILERCVEERLDVRRSTTSMRSTGSKIVKFQDEHKRSPPRTVPSKSGYDWPHSTGRFDSDDDASIQKTHQREDDRYSITTTVDQKSIVQPSSRKNVPLSKPVNGINDLVVKNINPNQSDNTLGTISALPRHTMPIPSPPVAQRRLPHDNEIEEESATSKPLKYDHDSQNLNEKRKIIERKLLENSTKEQHPIPNGVPVGFRPSREPLIRRDEDDNDDKSDSLTTLHTNPQQKPTVNNLPQLSGRESMNNNLLSSDDISHTYGSSLWKPNQGTSMEPRRPPTADSAKTSITDSDDN